MNRHEPTVIAAARSQMTASSPRGTFSQAELAGEPGDNPLYHPVPAAPPPGSTGGPEPAAAGRGACALGACLPAGQPGLGG